MVTSLTTSVKEIISTENHPKGEYNEATQYQAPQQGYFSIFFRKSSNYINKMKEGLGLPFFVLCITGLGYVLYKLNIFSATFLIFPLLFACLSIFIRGDNTDIRHQIVLYPFLVVCAAALLNDIFQSSDKFYPLKYILILIFFLPLYDVINYNLSISKPDSRNIAKKWIQSNIHAGTKILMDENGPPLLMNRERLREILHKNSGTDSKGQFTAHYPTFLEYQLLASKANESITYNLYEIRYPWWRKFEVAAGVHTLQSDHDKDMGNPSRPVGVESYDYYAKNGFEYVIVHSRKYNRFLKDTQISEKFPSFKRFYRELFKKGLLVKEFSPHELDCQGPTIKIFKFSP
jgi:hypothetical protein